MTGPADYSAGTQLGPGECLPCEAPVLHLQGNVTLPGHHLHVVEGPGESVDHVVHFRLVDQDGKLNLVNTVSWLYCPKKH